MFKKYQRYVTPLILLMTCVTSAYTQTIVSGRITDRSTNEGIPGVNVIIKGTSDGTASDVNGQFTLASNTLPPFVIQVSYIGYQTVEREITAANTSGIVIPLDADATQLQEIQVVGTNYGPVDFGSAPVTVEVVGQAELRQSPAVEAYRVLSASKGVSTTESSFNFPQLNTRGFATISNVRFVQLVDWMDVSAPLLNFPTGNIVGVSDLDLETMELVPGASSALYGPNAFNGILLMTSKSPFEERYQGLSAQVKIGASTSDAQDNELFPMYSFTARYAKSFNDKFAVKANFSYLKAEDWYGNDYKTDRVNPESTLDLSGRPDFDGLNLYGDEIEIPTGVPSIGTIHRTGFKEEDILDNSDAETIKGDIALHYRLTDKIEISYMYRYGGGSSVYQGSQKYALRDFTQQFNKLEFKGDNFFLRGYMTATDAGDSYNIGALGTVANEYYNPTQRADGTGWAQEYVLAMQGYVPGVPAGDHTTARAFADRNRPQPGTAAFNDLIDQVRNNYFQKNPPGAKFTDNSRLYHGEFQYRFKQIEFIDAMIGGNVRQYSLFSNGTIFNEDPDGDGIFERIIINEYGGYAQVSKTFKRGDLDALILTGSLRYDKNENFEGQTTPRISAVYSPSKNHHFRASFQTGFRNPDTQAQFIFFDVGTNILLGSTEANAAQYGVHNGGAWTIDSYRLFQSTGNASDLVTANIPYVKPEQLKAYEIGYKITAPKFFLDLNYYYTTYTDFIGSTYVASKNETEHRNEVLPPGTIFTPYYNSPAEVNSSGVGIGITYNLPLNGYQIVANYNYARYGEDKGQDPNFRAFFNTPENKYNVGLNYYESSKNFSFNVNYRWQDNVLWESDFGIGPIPSYGVFDAQVSYKLSSLKSVFKLGANNLFGGDYRTNFGGPFVGQVYYLAITFDPNQFTK